MPAPVQRNILILLLMLWAAVLLPSRGKAQQPYFRSIRLPEEFQQTSVNCMVQDLNNYLWIGTGKGLYQYDGSDFTYFPSGNGNDALPVTSLYMDASLTLWAGTRKGEIYRLQGDSLRLFRPEEGNPAVSITAFAEDSGGNLWFSTYGEGVYYYDGKRVYNIDEADGLTDNFCYSLLADDRGRIWVSTDGGISVCSLTNGECTIQKITDANGLPDNIVLSLAYSGKDIWVGMQDLGVCRIDINTFGVTVPRGSVGWKFGPVSTLAAGRNWLWIPTERNGIISLATLSGELNGTYPVTDHTNIPRISRIYPDRQGNCWVNTGTQLYVSPGQDLLFYPVSGNEAGSPVHSLCAGRKEQLWYSTDQGLFCRELTTSVTRRIALPLKKNIQIISLYEDAKGHIWAGTFGEGIYCIDPLSGRFRLYAEADGLSNGNILSITGKGNDIWLATLNGAYKFSIPPNPVSPGTDINFINFGDQHFPGNNYVYSAFADSRGRIWFGTDGRGISMLENGRFTNFDKSDGLRSNIIYSITEDSRGQIWFSTSNAGVYCYNGKTFRNYSVAEGLTDNSITGMLADRKDHLLMIHNNGWDILDIRNGSVASCSTGAGLTDISPDLNVCSLQGDHTAWIGTRTGIFRYEIPEDVSARQPVLRLTKVSVFPGEENFIGTHAFAYSQNHISFSFNALWFMAPSQVKYQIRLQGYDLGWIDTRNNRVTYSNLPPGKYTFQVRSSVGGNFSLSGIRSYSFEIGKPYWRTPWFIIPLLAAAGTFVYLLIRFREKTLKQRNEAAREKIMFQFQTLRSQVNPHFLFNSFSTLISIIDEDKQLAIEYVEKLSQFFRDILDYRDKELIPLGEELKLTETYYFIQQKRYCSNLRLTFSLFESELDTLIPPMVLQMLVENAIKHNVVSGEKPLHVKIYSSGRYVVVSNNLQPKTSAKPSTGIGLDNIRNRYTLLGYSDTVVEATTDEFIVKLPLIFPEK
jgi:ligand-binding sensor domain-containing protein